MECKQVLKILPVFLDGALKSDEIDAIGKHLESCEACRKEAVKYHKSWDLLSQWSDIEPPPAYISRFWTRLAAETSMTESVFAYLRNLLTPRKLVVAFSTLSVMVIIGLFVFHNYLPSEKAEHALAKMNPDEIELISNLELAQHFDVIENIDTIEDLDVIENLDSLES